MGTNLRYDRDLLTAMESLPVTTVHVRALRALLALAVVFVVGTGTSCSKKDLHIQNDDWANPELALKVAVPASATDVTKGLGGGTESYAYSIDFLMPNDQWRNYLQRYYPNGIQQSPLTYTPGTVPAECVQAFRGGVKLQAWVAGDDIPYFDSGTPARRHVSAIPDCKPGQVFVQWRLEHPATTTRRSPR